MPRPSLYDTLYGNFAGGLNLNTVSETDQVILSAFDNMQCIPNCRTGMLVHLPDYDLPDMTVILRGMSASAHQLMSTSSAILLKCEPRPQRIAVVMFDQHASGELRYATDAELRDIDLVRYGIKFTPEGRVLIRHPKRQQYLDARSAL